LISDVLPFGRLWYGEPSAISNTIGYAKFYSRSHNAVMRVYDKTGGGGVDQFGYQERPKIREKWRGDKDTL
jgi:hypothetical protein